LNVGAGLSDPVLFIFDFGIGENDDVFVDAVGIIDINLIVLDRVVVDVVVVVNAEVVDICVVVSDIDVDDDVIVVVVDVVVDVV